MDRSITPKSILIIVLVILAAWTLYPPNKTLKPGIDLAGGTSLTYEIDTHGLAEHEKKDLAQRMITVLRRRIDPANIQNLIWRPQGSNRFEVQMPLASTETRLKRQYFETVLSDLLSENVNIATIMHSLAKTSQQRAENFEQFAKNSPHRLEILNELAVAYDERKELQTQRDNLGSELKTQHTKLEDAELDIEQIDLKIGELIKLNKQKLTESLNDIAGSDSYLVLLVDYVNKYAEWAKVVEKLTDPESGKNIKYKNAKKSLDGLNLAEDQINFVLEMSPKSLKRSRIIEKLKTEFADRAEKVDNVITAFDKYRPVRGGLDDPKDLQRMLKGAGILEFRILPTRDRTELTTDEIDEYINDLVAKGPKFASKKDYVWCEVENVDEWRVSNSVVAPFGNKYYVLASNKLNESILHSYSKREWKLKSARPNRDEQGRRAIGFALDERGGRLFANVTGKNIGRPLCIVLDDIAISAPSIQTKISARGIITGSFTQTQVSDMVNKLNAGSLPARLIEQPISVKTIGPSIGADNRDKGIKAGLIGLVVVVLCMAVYYCLTGSVADVALVMNLLFILAMMAWLRATFTLPGIAGIILTIGMSVDANVLIFERIREEQQRGSSLRIAVRNGYQRAFRTILDANLTTFITAAILYGVASEEIKGFAIVLMLGIVSSMFTALFVTRVIFDFLLAKRIIKNHLFMLRLIHRPNIDWMALRPVFFTISFLLIAAGLIVFFTRDNRKNNKYDIEFTGGTSVQINLKNDIPIQQVRNRLNAVGTELNNHALAAANVYSIAKSKHKYEINTTETNKTIATIAFSEADNHTVETVTSAIKEAQTQIGGRLNNLLVTANMQDNSFVVTTSHLNKTLVESILKTAFKDANISEPQIEKTVNDAILTAFGDKLEIQQSLQPAITSSEKITEQLIDSYPEFTNFLGGLKLECKIERAATTKEIKQRLANLRFKPDMKNLDWYPYKILNSDLTVVDDPNQPIKSFIYISVEPEAGFRQLTDDDVWKRFLENETTKLLAAAKLETSLPRVTQIAPSIGAEAKTRALIAIILSLFAIVTYIWIRFGNVRYGIAAIIALVHDVCITLGAVTACTYIAATPIGEKLLIGDFKINLAMIAALLTIIGYSLNDTIVVFDRIRENRHKDNLNPQIIANSINQTLSRTLLTSFTTFIVVLIMYIFGGQGMRGFTFAIGFGIIIGTYSSIAIAAPVLLFGAKIRKEKSK